MIWIDASFKTGNLTEKNRARYSPKTCVPWLELVVRDGSGFHYLGDGKIRRFSRSKSSRSWQSIPKLC